MPWHQEDVVQFLSQDGDSPLIHLWRDRTYVEQISREAVERVWNGLHRADEAKDSDADEANGSAERDSPPSFRG